MRSNESSVRHGADPPKNESGRIGASSSYFRSIRSLKTGNGILISANLFKSEAEIPSISILHTRSCCLSAEMMSELPDRCDDRFLAYTTMGKVGQRSSLFFT